MKVFQTGRINPERKFRKTECQDDRHGDSDDKDFIRQTIIRQAPGFCDDQYKRNPILKEHWTIYSPQANS